MTDAPVCVTGASGFIASHLVADLLGQGRRVRGTVRNPAKGTDHIRALPGAAERLELVAADLTTDGAFDHAVEGTTHVIHTASPYALTVKDPQKDLVDPAVRGTESVLAACRKAGTVRRVVITSSMAAVTDEPEDDRVFSEADWNTTSTLTRNPYYLSKTLAERAAWKFVETERPGFDVVVVNPTLVVGPSLTAAVNTSNQVLVDLLRGRYPGILSLTWGIVDVRDVARAHVLAADQPNARGRYICAAATATMREVAAHVRRLGYKPPTLPLDNAVGNAIVRAASYLQPKGVGTYLRTHLGRRFRFDNSRIQRELGMTFRPLETTIADTMRDLERWGHVPKAISAAPPAAPPA